ncbi:MAG: ATP-dependent DNA helicase RecG [Patescibacteria group bacterium]|jgi:ATP-dependent DNA helicase RecG
MINLDSHLSELKQVGAVRAKILANLDLNTVTDLLYYFPFRYDDFGQVTKISELRAGQSFNIIGQIELIQNKRSFKRRIYLTEALISDDSETIKVIWFNQAFLTRTLQVGDRVSLAGKVSDEQGQLVMISPQYEKVSEHGLTHTQGLVPIYHLSATLTQKQLRSLVKQVIPIRHQLPDWLPATISQKLNLPSLAEALQGIHFPKDQTELLQAKRRLAFSELFLRQLRSQLLIKSLQTRSAPPLPFQETAIKEFVAQLPFPLTSSQRQVAWEILQDLEKAVPMNRLLEGDVGSGKTIVAIMAILNTVLSKHQAALMAPSQILAQQHYQTVSNFLKPYQLKIILLTAGHRATPTEITQADIIIGTQALIQKNVNFANLALVVVDEQHRFGVRQRQELASAGSLVPHYLSMTATPIPRSLTLTIYGDLSLSIIKELPANRQTVITDLVSEDRRAGAYQFIREQIKSGRQAFFVYPVIEPTSKLQVKSAKQAHHQLATEVFPDLEVGLLHGRLKTKEKEELMTRFLRQELDILVATSIIEVGIDIPNASIIVIEGAERFGLATLHQFRGRVGRSTHQSYCLLFPSSEEINNPKTLTRLNSLLKYQDGLSLAEIDLKLRGAGDLYGLAQSGFSELQIASLYDHKLIKLAQKEAVSLISDDPELKKYPLLKEKLGDWENEVHLE